MNSDRVKELGLKYMGSMVNDRDRELGVLIDRILREPDRLLSGMDRLSSDNARPFLSRMLTNVLRKTL